MSHTYASVADFKRYLIDQNEAEAAVWTDSDTIILTLLEGTSRRIDEWSNRSQYGSGFGPRTGTNIYDTWSWGWELPLDDDALSVTTLTVDGVSVGTADYRLLPRGRDQKRDLQFLAGSSGTAVQVTGTFGYSNETYALATGGSVSSAATSIVLTGGSAYAGQTLLIDTEQAYVTVSGGTPTIVRGVNGTTAATHAAAAAVSAYRYPRDVVSACLQVTARRHRMAQAGVTGDFGGGSLPITGHRDSEASVLRSTIGHLRLFHGA